MRKDKKDIFKLRKQGRSYKEIMSTYGISKSTLSSWFGGSDWSRAISVELTEKAKKLSSVRIKELDRVRGENLNRLYNEARMEAQNEFYLFRFDPLFLAGVLLYWGEGDKINKHQLRISNSDPIMIKLFYKFLARICGDKEARIRLYLIIYPDLNPDKCINFWSQAVGINKKHFCKCTVIKGRHKTRKLNYGTCSIGISSRFLKEKMLIWLNLLPSALLESTSS